MKNIILSICCAFLFIACGENSSEDKRGLEKEVKKESQVQNSTSNDTPKITITSNETNIEKNSEFISYDIDGNKTIKISPDGQETPLTKELGALISIKNSYEKLNSKILAQRLSKTYMQKCSACHDNYANGVIGPSLLNKSEDEIFDIINAYKTKTKVNVLMKDLVSQMPEEEIKALAKEIAELNKFVKER